MLQNELNEDEIARGVELVIGLLRRRLASKWRNGDDAPLIFEV